MKHVKITLDVDIEDEAAASLEHVVDHHIDQLIDIKSWPEIKSVYDAKMEIEHGE